MQTNESPDRVLRAHGSPLAVQLAGALKRREADFDDDENRWFGKIEQRREELLADDRVVHGPHTVADLTHLASKKPRESRQLAAMVRAARPTTVLELGTNVGLSGAYQAAALELNGHGRLVTLEGNANRAEVAAATFRAIGTDRAQIKVGLFQDTLAPTLAELGEVTSAFVDGHHKEEPTWTYHDMILERLTSPGYIVYDDITHSDEMERVWAKIVDDPRISVGVSLGRIGLIVRD